MDFCAIFCPYLAIFVLALLEHILMRKSHKRHADRNTQLFSPPTLLSFKDDSSRLAGYTA